MLDYLKLKIYRRLRARFKPHQTRLAGYKVSYNDPRSLFAEYKNIFKNRCYYFDSARPDPLIIDGGGHIGMSVLYFKKIYPASRVLVFEPDILALEMLRRNIADNRLADVRVVESGLYSEDGVLNFNQDMTDGGKIAEDGAGSIRVERLSKYINDEVDFLKLNIEGAEGAVLEELGRSGKLELVREMVFEWHSFARQAQDLSRVLAVLEKNNFKYLVNDYGHPINQPPFKLADKTKYWLLVYAKRRDLL